jgi:hypothetical protein
MDTVVDFVTGAVLPDIGPEANRQQFERFLVESKGYAPSDITVNAPLAFPWEADIYRSHVDLVVSLDGRPLLAVKCVAGSLGSWEREILAAARICHPDHPLPLAVVTDGQNASLLDTASGKCLGTGLEAVPSRAELAARAQDFVLAPLPEKRLARERIIFRAYDLDNVHAAAENGSRTCRTRR